MKLASLVGAVGCAAAFVVAAAGAAVGEAADAAARPASLSRPRAVGDPADPWARVTAELNAFRDNAANNFSRFAFSAGDASGSRFSYEDAGVGLDERLLLASASKFPSALAIAGAVASGHIGFDTTCADVFDWWSGDAADKRSRVTLRHLLSLTSGLYWEDDGSGGVPCMTDGILFTPEECARQIYDLAPWEFEPGTTFAYNSFHLQVAGAMAAKAANTTVRQLIDDLFEKANMTRSGYLPGQNPLMAAGMYTVGRDYERLLSKYVAYELLPKAVCDEIERDYLSAPFATHVANSSTGLTSYFGHYSMANWFECMPGITPGARNGSNGTSEWGPACARDDLHMDLGLFGYFPMVDRANGYYLQIPQMVVVSGAMDNPACAGAVALRGFIKPWVDWAMRNGTGPPPPNSTGARRVVLPAAATEVQDEGLEVGLGRSAMGLPQDAWDGLVAAFEAL